MTNTPILQNSNKKKIPPLAHSFPKSSPPSPTSASPPMAATSSPATT